MDVGDHLSAHSEMGYVALTYSRSARLCKVF